MVLGFGNSRYGPERLLPLFAWWQFPGFAFLQLVIHFGSFVIETFEVPISTFKGHFRLDTERAKGSNKTELLIGFLLHFLFFLSQKSCTPQATELTLKQLCTYLVPSYDTSLKKNSELCKTWTSFQPPFWFLQLHCTHVFKHVGNFHMVQQDSQTFPIEYSLKSTQSPIKPLSTRYW